MSEWRLNGIKPIHNFGLHLNIILDQIVKEVGDIDEFYVFKPTLMIPPRQPTTTTQTLLTHCFIKLKQHRYHGRLVALLDGHLFHGTQLKAGYATFDFQGYFEHLYPNLDGQCAECEIFINTTKSRIMQQAIEEKEREHNR